MFNNDTFADPDLDIERFVNIQRRSVTLQNLADELEKYIERVNNELFSIINNDYNAFLELSAQLINIDSMVAVLRCPLQLLDSEVLTLYQVMKAPIDEYNDLKTRLKKLNYKRKLLELCIVVWNSLESVEKDCVKYENLSDMDTSNPSLMTSQIQQSVQIITNINFLSNQNLKLPLLNMVQNKVKKLEYALLSQLEIQFGVEVVPCSNSKDQHVIDQSALIQCLRSYAAIGRITEAENCFKKLVVLPYLNEIMTSTRLQGKIRGSCSGLPSIYSDIIDFTVNKCQAILSITYDEQHGLSQFDFVTNSICIGFCEVIKKKLSGSIFSSGVADTLHSNYMTTIELFNFMQQISINPSKTKKIGDDFMKNWNLPVYYQLRKQEMTLSFETVLNQEILWPSDDSNRYHLKASQFFFDLYERCYDENIVLTPIVSKFFNFSIQLIVRYTRWCNNGLDSFLQTSSPNTEQDNDDELGSLDSAAGRAWSSVTELQVFGALSDDCRLLSAAINNSVTMISAHLPSVEPAKIQLVMDDMRLHLNKIIERCNVICHDKLFEQCAGELKGIHSITSMYRFANKDKPTTHCPFIEKVLAPIGKYLTSPGGALTAGHLAEWKTKLINSITQRYKVMAAETMETLAKLEESLKRRRNKNTTPDKNPKLSDADLIRLQFQLDAEEYARQASILDVDIKTDPEYIELVALFVLHDAE